MLYSSFKLVFNPLITLIVFYVTLVVKSRYKIMDNFHSIHYLRCNDFWILALEAGSLSRNPMLQLTFCYFGRQLVSLAPVVFSDNYFHNCICHAELLEIRYLKAVRIRYLVSTQWMTLDKPVTLDSWTPRSRRERLLVCAWVLLLWCMLSLPEYRIRKQECWERGSGSHVFNLCVYSIF